MRWEDDVPRWCDEQQFVPEMIDESRMGSDEKSSLESVDEAESWTRLYRGVCRVPPFTPPIVAEG
jgi:hypothetical protein